MDKRLANINKSIEKPDNELKAIKHAKAGYKIDRNVVLGMYVQGYRKSDIAKILNVSRSAICTMIGRVEKNLSSAKKIKEMRGDQATVNHQKLMLVLMRASQLNPKFANPEHLLKLARHCYDVSRIEDGEATSIIENKFTEVISPIEKAKIIDIEEIEE